MSGKPTHNELERRVQELVNSEFERERALDALRESESELDIERANLKFTLKESERNLKRVQRVSKIGNQH